MNKRDVIIYRAVTGILSAMILMGVFQYFFNHEMVKGMFTTLKYPTYLIYPLGFVKALGLIAIWSNKSKILKEWAYAGFTFNLLLGASAHMNINDGGYYPSLVALTLLIVSYVYNRKLYS